jgi:hypothetical protein
MKDSEEKRSEKLTRKSEAKRPPRLMKITKKF